MSIKIMVCMVDNVMKGGRIYKKGDHREAVVAEKDTKLWQSLETVEKRRQQETAARLAAEEQKSLKKLQEENAKLRVKVKDLEAALAEKAPKKQSQKAKAEPEAVETQDNE